MLDLIYGLIIVQLILLLEIQSAIINNTFAEKSYRTHFNKRIKQYGDYFADNVSVLFSIQKYFDSMKNIQNLLSNVSNVMHKDGYFIVTTLDGPSVFDALKRADKNIIQGTVYNYSKNKKWKFGRYGLIPH